MASQRAGHNLATEQQLCFLTSFQSLLTAQFHSHFHIFRICYSSTSHSSHQHPQQFSTAATANHQRLNCLEEIRFIISQFCRPQIQHGCHWAKIKASAGLCSSLEAQAEYVPLVIQVVGRTKILVVEGLRFLFSCWQLPEGHSQLLEAIWIP